MTEKNISQEFRMKKKKKIDKTRNFFNEEIDQDDLMSKITTNL